jgi:hypothetical protein
MLGEFYKSRNSWTKIHSPFSCLLNAVCYSFRDSSEMQYKNLEYKKRNLQTSVKRVIIIILPTTKQPAFQLVLFYWFSQLVRVLWVYLFCLHFQTSTSDGFSFKTHLNLDTNEVFRNSTCIHLSTICLLVSLFPLQYWVHLDTRN